MEFRMNNCVKGICRECKLLNRELCPIYKYLHTWIKTDETEGLLAGISFWHVDGCKIVFDCKYFDKEKFLIDYIPFIHSKAD